RRSRHLSSCVQQTPGHRQSVARSSAARFEGFVNASVLAEALRRAGPALSTDAFIRALESAEPIRFGRFGLTYTSSAHPGSTYVELAIIDESGQLRY
ncbi:MAG TPA: hypothetical protein PKV56_17820, partial [Burkholderiaceae bacterium]|nr:hypothetical protein [Burkholderiaceae bacterium]